VNAVLFVLLDQNFAQIERLPAHLDGRRGSKRADAHDREVGVDAAVEEIEIEMARHGSLSTSGEKRHGHILLAWRDGTRATARVHKTPLIPAHSASLRAFTPVHSPRRRA
jgi:hypothetical protein